MMTTSSSLRNHNRNTDIPVASSLLSTNQSHWHFVKTAEYRELKWVPTWCINDSRRWAQNSSVAWRCTYETASNVHRTARQNGKLVWKHHYKAIISPRTCISKCGLSIIFFCNSSHSKLKWTFTILWLRNCIASRESVDNQVPRNTNFTH